MSFLLSILLSGWGVQAGGEPSPPNLLLVLADDLGYGDLGCFNEESRIRTPRLDALASEGMRFTDAHSASAVCSPSRYAILTGRYCWRTWLGPDVVGGYTPPVIEPHRPTLPGMLREAGYLTGMFGKWHLGLGWTRANGTVGTWENAASMHRGSWQDGDPDEGLNVDWSVPIQGGPNALGFDRAFYTAACSTIDGPFCYIENDRPTVVPDRMIPVDRSKHPDFRPRPGWMAEGFDLTAVDPTFTAQAIEFIRASEAADADRPWFAYLALSSPHAPWLPPEDLLGTTAEGPRGDLVALVDRCVGELLDGLEELGIAGETLVLVTSDNGPRPGGYLHASAGELRGFKSHAWEGGHRVPFLARWPGRIPAGRVENEPIELTDLFASLATLTGAEVPEGGAPDSHDVSAAFLGHRFEPPLRPFVVSQSVFGAFAIRVGRWKLVHETDGSGGWVPPRGARPRAGAPGQLYDLEADPGETENLFETRPEVVARLAATLEDLRRADR